MNKTIPQLKTTNDITQLYVNKKPFLILGGELRNSSASNINEINYKFEYLNKLNLNSVIASLSWELIEPREGCFDFTLLDAMITQARKYNLKLVFLWFGVWKNAKSCYAPEWVKTDIKRYPRVQIINGNNTNIISPFHTQITLSEEKAFSKTMQYIKKLDKKHKTVLMIQVENEAGILGGPRDFSNIAEKYFSANVPAELISYLKTNKKQLLPNVLQDWGGNNFKEKGSWSEIFAHDAEEIFMAWHIASHIEKITSAGKKQYNLPMYVNAWLKQDHCPHPGQYPSGGPISDMLDIWKAAAPHIDFIAPDIYTADFKEVCASYTRKNNPLFIPETYYQDNRSAASVFLAFAQYAGIGFAPFAIDDIPLDHPLAISYKTLQECIPLLSKCQVAKQCIGFYQQEENENSTEIINNYKIRLNSILPLSKAEIPGGGMVLMLKNNEFIIIGRNYCVGFSSLNSDRTNLELLYVDAGIFDNGKFVSQKRLNGDETFHGSSVILGNHLTICKVKVNFEAGEIFHQAEWEFPK